MRRVLQPIRVATIFFMIVIFLAHMGVIWLLVRRRWPRVRWANRILSHYCKFGLWILKVKVTPLGFDQLADIDNALYVGNHLSYLDVLVISSQKPMCFVTSVEVKKTPGLGTICRMAGCLFVERRSRANLMNEVGELSEGLKHFLNVGIFPESTSSNGEQILRFKRPLFLAAVQAGTPIVPFCLNYFAVGGQPINRVSRDSVFWYGDMDFIPHLWSLAGAGGVSVNLHFLKPISVNEQSDPTALAGEAQAAVEAVFQPVR